MTNEPHPQALIRLAFDALLNRDRHDLIELWNAVTFIEVHGERDDLDKLGSLLLEHPLPSIDEGTEPPIPLLNRL